MSATFRDTPDFLDAILVPVAEIESDLNDQEDLLRTHVEWTSSPLDFVPTDSVADINEKIGFANRLNLILWAPTTKIDQKIADLLIERNKLATLAEIPGLSQAIKDDLKLLTWSEDGIPTATGAPFGQAGSILWDMETATPPATYSGTPPLANTPEYAVALKLREELMGADSRNYWDFKSDITTNDGRYYDASWSVKTQDMWTTLTSPSGLAWTTMNIISIINSN